MSINFKLGFIVFSTFVFIAQNAYGQEEKVQSKAEIKRAEEAEKLRLKKQKAKERATGINTDGAEVQVDSGNNNLHTIEADPTGKRTMESLKRLDPKNPNIEAPADVKARDLTVAEAKAAGKAAEDQLDLTEKTNPIKNYPKKFQSEIKDLRAKLYGSLAGDTIINKGNLKDTFSKEVIANSEKIFEDYAKYREAGLTEEKALDKALEKFDEEGRKSLKCCILGKCQK